MPQRWYTCQGMYRLEKKSGVITYCYYLQYILAGGSQSANTFFFSIWKFIVYEKYLSLAILSYTLGTVEGKFIAWDLKLSLQNSIFI